MYLSAWAIQDGNFSDTSVGETLRYAIRLGPSQAEIHREGDFSTEPGLRRFGASYRAQGKIVLIHRRHNLMVVDFESFSALATLSRWEPTAGRTFSGNVILTVDAFEYRETYSRIRGMPPIDREWLITGIFRESQADEAASYLVNGAGLVGVQKTDAFSDRGGHAEYVLRVRSALRAGD